MLETHVNRRGYYASTIILQKHHTMPKDMLCQHTAGFSQVDEEFFQTFFTDINTDWGVSTVSLGKTMLHKLGRKVIANTPTHGFKDLILWNFLRLYCLVNGVQAWINRGEFVNPLQAAALARGLCQVTHWVTKCWRDPGSAATFWMVRKLHTKF